MTKIHFRPYNPNQTVLFPPRIDERILQSMIQFGWLTLWLRALNLESFRVSIRNAAQLYPSQDDAQGHSVCYMNNIYSCRKKSSLHRDIHYIWLVGYEKPISSPSTASANWVKNEINEVFTQTVLLLSLPKASSAWNVEYIDGQDWVQKANKVYFRLAEKRLSEP